MFLGPLGVFWGSPRTVPAPIRLLGGLRLRLLLRVLDLGGSLGRFRAVWGISGRFGAFRGVPGCPGVLWTLTSGSPSPGRAQGAVRSRARSASATGPCRFGGGNRGPPHWGQRCPAGAVRGGSARAHPARHGQWNTSGGAGGSGHRKPTRERPSRNPGAPRGVWMGWRGLGRTQTPPSPLPTTQTPFCTPPAPLKLAFKAPEAPSATPKSILSPPNPPKVHPVSPHPS